MFVRFIHIVICGMGKESVQEEMMIEEMYLVTYQKIKNKGNEVSHREGGYK